MNENFGIAIFAIFISLLLIIFCTFFTARLAQLKNRSRVWGLLGLFLNIIGLIIVCYLPSKRKDGLQTNPIKHLLSRIPSVSRKTIGLIAAIAIVAIITIIAYDNIPKMIENYKYSKEISKFSDVVSEQPKLINVAPKEIFIGTECSFMVSEDNNLYCWGKQLSSQIEGEERGVIYKDVKKADSNGSVCFVLTNSGSLYAMGDNSRKLIPSKEEYVSEFTLISENVIDFDVSETTVGYIKKNKKLFMYGDNGYGQLGTYNQESKTEGVPVLGNVKKVVCESSFTVAMQENGDVAAFGSNAFRQFGIEGEVFNSPTVISKNCIDIAAGDDFILVLNKNGELFSCGNNSSGQLGNKTDEDSVTFMSILTNVSNIHAARKCAVAITNNNELYSWGQNNVGQLGHGSDANTNTPTLAKEGIVTAYTNGTHTIAHTTDNEIISTGLNTFGQLGKGGTRNNFAELVGIK